MSEHTGSRDPQSVVVAVRGEAVHDRFVLGRGVAADPDRTALLDDDRPRLEERHERGEASLAKSRIEDAEPIHPGDGAHAASRREAVHRRDDAVLAIEGHVEDRRNLVDHDATCAERSTLATTAGERCDESCDQATTIRGAHSSESCIQCTSRDFLCLAPGRRVDRDIDVVIDDRVPRVWVMPAVHLNRAPATAHRSRAIR
ncbi:MAG TPA: hypothetical protein VGD80_42415 [Kofleriaceae bacterium]